MPLDREHAAPARRIAFKAALLLIPLLGGAFLVPHVLRQLRGGEPAPAQQEERGDRPPTEEEIAASAKADRKASEMDRALWENASHIAPEEARVDAWGERTARFQGFGVSVDSEPAGARVIVNGEDLGETPLVTSVHCEPGTKVQLRIEKPPLAPARRVTTCRADTLVELSAKLRR
jgi:hypothetical protein